MWTPTHHLLFTLFHVDLQTKSEAPKPVSLFICSTYSMSGLTVTRIEFDRIYFERIDFERN
jgi:hypothetical protein